MSKKTPTKSRVNRKKSKSRGANATGPTPKKHTKGKTKEEKDSKTVPVLTYWDCAGRAQVARLIFVDAGKKFVDKRLCTGSTKWIDVAAGCEQGLKFDLDVSGPCHTLPMLSMDDVRINQTLAVSNFAGELCGYALDTPEARACALMVNQLCYEELLVPLWNVVWGSLSFEDLLGKTPTDGLLFHLGCLEKILASNKENHRKKGKKNQATAGYFIIGSTISIADFFVMYTVDTLVRVFSEPFWGLLSSLCPLLAHHNTCMNARPNLQKYKQRGSGTKSAEDEGWEQEDGGDILSPCMPVKWTGAPGEERSILRLRVAFQETLNWEEHQGAVLAAVQARAESDSAMEDDGEEEEEVEVVVENQYTAHGKKEKEKDKDTGEESAKKAEKRIGNGKGYGKKGMDALLSVTALSTSSGSSTSSKVSPVGVSSLGKGAIGPEGAKAKSAQDPGSITNVSSLPTVPTVFANQALV